MVRRRLARLVWRRLARLARLTCLARRWTSRFLAGELRFRRRTIPAGWRHCPGITGLRFIAGGAHGTHFKPGILPIPEGLNAKRPARGESADGAWGFQQSCLPDLPET
ncbi:hypothetical protein ARGLB_008_00800 [Arthrobacter globiformis NBRC 12137]|uniref:Uncharacterized protein n=1 Tax=Arthrobacter globiformis (strain ATCC 8010 / DSM 20124 / JCM 1332 / NBRC 12137 / NCIMB 8907 / NRRL B-2979 / 168) TaxID=1077972 RepID=H0QGV6_ARTG1|nr:hypothetical protein ARGLB_008_00800 [Arthrobacter globiformis NBRC 12137]